MTRDLPRFPGSETLRTDGGDGNHETSGSDVLAVLESVDIRAYDSAEAVPEPIAEEGKIALLADIGFDITAETVIEIAMVHTPRISIALEYVGEESFQYSGGTRLWSCFLSDFNSTTGLHLSPAETSINRTDDRCWIATPLGESMALQTGEIQPYDTREREFDIVADPEKNSCYPQGQREILQRCSFAEKPPPIRDCGSNSRASNQYNVSIAGSSATVAVCSVRQTVSSFPGEVVETDTGRGEGTVLSRSLLLRAFRQSSQRKKFDP
ncbi:hypothetical protein [Halosolutus gelatinilyticus]|uniref:hypothetical protein n=1 Tax=Halosolutus gelatinilyticus TaxID=2931975 RepID=UPI001FF5E2AD|nr:hypothetical protein [Halosolutus gelatinilyticus]